jgi:hypothetical protein
MIFFVSLNIEKAINLLQKFDLFDDQWSPKISAESND